MQGMVVYTQQSNAKIQRHFRVASPQTLQKLEKKTCKTFVEKWYKSSTVRENYKLGVSEDVHLVDSLVICEVQSLTFQ